MFSPTRYEDLYPQYRRTHSVPLPSHPRNRTVAPIVAAPVVAAQEPVAMTAKEHRLANNVRFFRHNAYNQIGYDPVKAIIRHNPYNKEASYEIITSLPVMPR